MAPLPALFLVALVGLPVELPMPPPALFCPWGDGTWSDRLEEGLSLYSDPVPLLPTPRPPAQALDCHVCAYNGENCFNPMHCPATVTYCMTTRTYYTPTRMKVTKSCVPSCFETVYDGYSKHASATSCCQYDLCNGTGLPMLGTLTLVPILLATLWGLL
ncbi:hypothetical protein MC885_015546 [Smutsia gigantea]|nr:hypothetical protein MC885_015546 [Smutsia gigantea]